MRALAALVLFSALLPAFQPSTLDNLYQSNLWFDFRDAMLQSQAPAFYRGQLALAFHDWPQAEKDFSTVMKAGGDSTQALEAARGLYEIYSLTGRYQDARSLLARTGQMMRSLEASRAIDPAARQSFEKLRRQLAAVSGYPDQAIVARGASRLFYAEVENRLTIPLTVNGAPANYLIDTGAQTSVIGVAEAKRLGLTVLAHAVAVDTISPEVRNADGVAIAADVVIGNFHLRNVRFLVMADANLDGILGLPVLLAFQTLRWNSDGTIEFGFPSEARNLSQSNLCLVNSSLLTNGGIGERKLALIVDTGSYDTTLFPRFARDFAGFMKTPLPVVEREIGNGVTDPKVTILPDLALRVGGLQTHLNPAEVLSRDLLEDPLDSHGLLGMDLLGQARSVTFDLGAMRLTLDGVDRAAQSCGLPPDFTCAPGWRCSVKQSDDGPCFVNRLPMVPWPGNAVASERADGNHCVLSPGANCESGKLCRVVFDSNQSCRIVAENPGSAPETAPALESVSAVGRHPDAPSTEVGQGPDNAREIVQRFLKYDSLDIAPARDYIYLANQETKVFNKDGSVRQTNTETREVMNLYDANYSRLIRKDGQELSPEKARAEQARFDKAVDKRAHETPEAKARREEAERKQAAEGLLCEREFFTVFDAHGIGTESVNGRPSWIVEVEPRANAKPNCSALKAFAKFRVKIWIDRQEYRAARMEADNIAPVTWGAFLVRLPAGGIHVEFEQQRHDDGVWLESREDDRMNAKALLFVPARLEILTTYSGYRKFKTDSRILPAGGN